MKKRLLLFLIVSFLVGHFNLQAQALQVTGAVSDAKTNEKLPGVSIALQGSNKGTITDADGKFTIEVPDANAVLVFSYVSYVTETVPVNGRSVIDMALVPDIKKLDEVVVVGYGSSKRSDLTGAVASVNEETLRATTATTIDQALQGRIAGVQVTQNSGQPGGATSIRIRGASSITGTNEPLYVIDGVTFKGNGPTIAGFDWAGGANGQNVQSPLSTIPPSDIVSIEVLKDASASAIYGSDAANGVVIVTTKRGKKGESKVSYNGYYAIQKLPKKLDMMALPQFAEYQNQIRQELNLGINYNYYDPSILGNGTDWQDEIFRTAGSYSHQLSVTGGTDKTTFALSGGFMNQDGIIIGSKFNRYNLRLNVENQFTKWLKIGGNVAYSKTHEVVTLQDGGDGVIMQALTMGPDVPVKDIDGNYAGPASNVAGISYNPVAEALMRTNTVDRKRLSGNVYLNADIVKGLNFRSEIAIDDNSSINTVFQPTFTWGALVNKQSQMREVTQSSFYWGVNNYLTYSLKLGDKHNLSAMIGIENKKSTWEGVQVTKKNFTSNEIQVLSQGDDATSSTNGWKDLSTMTSYFGRFNYNYGDRYLATFTIRKDGSSKFGPNNKWGNFPSASLAWRVSNENFIKNNVRFINNMKLRLGYGAVGNTPGPTYLYGSSVVPLTTPFGTAYRSEKIANPNLQWESSKQYNLGLDLAVLDSRLELTVDIYKKFTDNMLLQLTIPSYLGGVGGGNIGAPFANVGKMENKGIEIGLVSRNIQSKKFNWTMDGSFTVNRNKVTALANEGDRQFQNLYWYSEFQTATVVEVGKPLGMFYGYKMLGVFKDQADILASPVQIKDPATGKNLVNKTQGVWPGDVKFKDINGDGVIDTKDQCEIGDPNPLFTFGFNNKFTYGPFDLTIYLNGSYGGKLLNYSRVTIEGMNSVFGNQAATVVNRAHYGYTDPNGSTTDPANVFLTNPDTKLPRPTTTDNNRNTRMSDRWIEDGSYLRIQNVTLAYTIPSKITKKIKIDRMRVYVNGQNLHTFTNYTGYDPEIGAFNQDARRQGIDMGRYPTPRLVTFGVDVDF